MARRSITSRQRRLMGASPPSAGCWTRAWSRTWQRCARRSPIQPVTGMLVSDRLHLASETLALDDSPSTWPPNLLASVRTRPAQQDVSDAAVALYGSAREPYEGAGALALDRFYASVFEGVRE